MKDNAIIVKELTKTYRLYESNKRRILEGLFPFCKQQHKDFNALSEISFSIKKGEIVGIIGKNGSGKSTLLKIITGVLTQTSGTVEINGKISALLELGTGFNPEYTGIENIYLSGSLNGIPRDEMAKRVPDILDFADIGDFINQPVKNYSSGMFVRLAFAVAVSVEPEILIVDEALSVGDAAFQAKCMARMIQIMKQGATVLFVTHDMDAVKQLCERCIYLEDGKIIHEGPAPQLADIYLRRAREKMNQENISLQKGMTHEEADPETSDTPVPLEAIKDEEFEKQVQRFREGDGEAKIIRVELLDEEGNTQDKFKYNQQIHLKFYVQFYKNLSGVQVGYHIKDAKNTQIIGSDMRLENVQYLTGKINDIFCVEYVTRLPLMAGAYNLTAVVSSPISRTTAVFHDLVENVKVFEVSENDAKVWNKVYIPNKINVAKCNSMV